MLNARPWVPEGPENYIQTLAKRFAGQTPDQNERDLLAFVEENRVIHERDCFNLNPATNAINPKAEAPLASGVGSRPSLGYPGDKYEMGLEGVEKIEVLAAELVAEVFGANYAEVRVASGQLANLYAYMLAAKSIEKVAVHEKDATYIPISKLQHAIITTKGMKGLTGEITCRPNGDCSQFRPVFYEFTSGDAATFEVGKNPKPVKP